MPRYVRQTALIVICAVCVSSLPLLLVGELPGERWPSANDNRSMYFALAGAELLAACVLLPIPSSIFGTMLRARLGFAAGIASAFEGLMVGQSTSYFVSRRFLGKRRVALPEAPALAVLFLSRPVPVLAEAEVLSAGAARVNCLPFLLAWWIAQPDLRGCAGAQRGATAARRANRPRPAVAPMLLPTAAWLNWRVACRFTCKGG
jgi:uncharacterized membrane protein YdjX (TVP38/TMEM64 family)